jgi:precorrin-2/cobalt-factor-2 C20-methyltransferase
MSGKLIGVGVGPGDPELITFKAARLIQSAPVLAYVIDANGKSYARDTVCAHIRLGQIELPLSFSMSPNRPTRLLSRRDAANKVRTYLQDGVDVVFITEGDPLLYSTFQHLLEEMPADIQVEVCPGISALFSASASACFPLAIEGQLLVVAPAETATGNLREWLLKGYTLVLFKVAHRLEKLMMEIKKSGLQCETILMEHASMENEVITRDMSHWIDHEVPYFSIILLRLRTAQVGAE